jgi:L-serine/L-threonine ammonia-lyase
MRCVVFIVCGGFKVSISDVTEFWSMVEEALRDPGSDWEVRCHDGELFRVPKQKVVDRKKSKEGRSTSILDK